MQSSIEVIRTPLGVDNSNTVPTEKRAMDQCRKVEICSDWSQSIAALKKNNRWTAVGDRSCPRDHMNGDSESADTSVRFFGDADLRQTWFSCTEVMSCWMLSGVGYRKNSGQLFTDGSSSSNNSHASCCTKFCLQWSCCLPTSQCTTISFRGVAW